MHWCYECFSGVFTVDALNVGEWSLNFGLNTYDFKSIAEDIAPFVCQIFNSMLDTETFPSILPRNNRVFGLWKAKGSREDPSKYRPICISPWLSKILQKALLIRLIDLAIEIHLHQHAYQAGKSTATALLDLRNTLRTHPFMLFVDYKGCFEAVSHQPLLHKLSSKSRHASTF